MTDPTMTKTVALLPCPFCGGEAKIERGGYQRPAMRWAQCRKCEASSTAYENADDAIAAWNTRTSTRAEQPCADMVERLVREAYEEGVEDGVGWHAAPMGDPRPQWLDSDSRAAIEATQTDQQLREEVERLRAVMQDPAAVHLNMLRGGIAKPSVPNIWHLYGVEALLAEAPEEALSSSSLTK